MLGDPVTRDVEPGCNPDAIVAERIVKEPRERERASGPADQAAVQADRHHLWRDVAFGIERVERILEIGVELIAGVEALRGGEAHVVGVERIGRHELRAARPLEPVRQIVRIGVGAIENPPSSMPRRMVLIEERPW